MRCFAGKIFCPPIVLGALALVLTQPSAWAQKQQQPNITRQNNGSPIGDASAIIVHVQEAQGGPLTEPALVNLSNVDDAQGYQTGTGPGSIAQFNGVRGGEYTIKVSAAGYKDATTTVTVMTDNGVTNSFVAMQPDNVSDSVRPERAGVPILVGKARKELGLAVVALHDNRPSEAKPHIIYILKNAPGNPEVQYLAGLYSLFVKDQADARTHLEAAVNILPAYSPAQIALGSLLLETADPFGAIVHMEKALNAEPNSWRAHWLIAEAYLLATGDTERARFHATKALELGKEKAAGAQITLARAQALSGDHDGASKTLQQFLKDHADDPGAPQAEQILKALETSATKAPDQQTPPPPPVPTAHADPFTLSTDVAPGSLVGLPKGVDDAIPPVNTSIPCSLPQVLEGASRRALEFTIALERFSAREEVVHDELDNRGVTQRTAHQSFNYVAALEHPSPNMILVDEMRNGQFALENFPAPFASQGLPALDLIFHPDFAEDFTFSCEGLGEWHGEPAWQVHFAQRKDRPARIHEWRVASGSYPTRLKGRAWISAHTYRPLHLETDLMEPITPIALGYEHTEVDYAPVKFPDGKRELWLPQSAVVYGRFRGHYFRQQHDFRDFLLFSAYSKETMKIPQ
jgi:tetratricopeptide (TPR) repeat protein